MFGIKRKKAASSVIAKATAKSKKAISLFAVAHDQLEQANAELNETAHQARMSAEAMLAHADQASVAVQENRAVQQKLKDFIPQA